MTKLIPILGLLVTLSMTTYAFDLNCLSETHCELAHPVSGNNIKITEGSCDISATENPNTPKVAIKLTEKRAYCKKKFITCIKKGWRTTTSTQTTTIALNTLPNATPETICRSAVSKTFGY